MNNNSGNGNNDVGIAWDQNTLRNPNLGLPRLAEDPKTLSSEGSSQGFILQGQLQTKPQTVNPEFSSFRVQGLGPGILEFPNSNRNSLCAHHLAVAYRRLIFTGMWEILGPEPPNP